MLHHDLLVNCSIIGYLYMFSGLNQRCWVGLWCSIASFLTINCPFKWFFVGNRISADCVDFFVRMLFGWLAVLSFLWKASLYLDMIFIGIVWFLSLWLYFSPAVLHVFKLTWCFVASLWNVISIVCPYIWLFFELSVQLCLFRYSQCIFLHEIRITRKFIFSQFCAMFTLILYMIWI